MTRVPISPADRPEALLCETLARGTLPHHLTDEDLASLWDRARVQDVDVLTASVLLRSAGRLPKSIHRHAHQRLADAGLRDLLRHRELCQLSAACAAAGVDLLLLKGAGLAYTAYPEPFLRPGRDVDLFIRRDGRDAAERALAACGYQRMREPDGELAHAQRHYVRADGNGVNHFVDLHWGIANVREFADALSFEDAWQASIVIDAIDPPARTLGIPEALVLACVHRVAHHQDAVDLLWLWDIHRLAGLLTAAGAEAVASRARRTGMRAVTARGLELAHDRFGTRLPGDLLAGLAAAGPPESAAQFLGGRMRRIDIVRSDVARVGRWKDRAALVREHLFPPRRYMRAIYPRCPSVLLPVAYVDRIARGAPKWFRLRS